MHEAQPTLSLATAENINNKVELQEDGFRTVITDIHCNEIEFHNPCGPL